MLWLYTIEPAFYHHIHEACAQMSIEHLETLGPMAYTINKILEVSEETREDITPRGQQFFLQSPLGTMNQSFNIYKCLYHPTSQREQWQEQSGRWINVFNTMDPSQKCLRGPLFCSRNAFQQIGLAMRQSCSDSDHHLVLF